MRGAAYEFQRNFDSTIFSSCNPARTLKYRGRAIDAFLATRYFEMTSRFLLIKDCEGTAATPKNGKGGAE